MRGLKAQQHGKVTAKHLLIAQTTAEHCFKCRKKADMIIKEGRGAGEKIIEGQQQCYKGQ